MEKLVEFEFDYDNEDYDNAESYVASDVQWIYINDSNNKTYSNGYINWTNLNIIGSSLDRFFGWADGYVTIPYDLSINLVQTGTPSVDNRTFYTTKNLSKCIAPKGWQHLVDWASIKFNGVQVTRSAEYTNFFMTQEMKKMNDNQYRLWSSILHHAWDTGDTMNLDASFGEVNNVTLSSASDFSTVNAPGGQNQGHVRRTAYCVDNRDVSKNSIAMYGQQSNGLLYNNYGQNCVVSASGTSINIRGVAVVPLWAISDFFKNIPTVASSMGFELRVRSNLARENSYTLNFDANGNNVGLSAIQAIGHTCPWLLSAIDASGASGLGVNAGAGITKANPYSITITQSIGDPTGAMPCRIYLPSIQYTTAVQKQIALNTPYSVKYLDHYVDIITNIGKGQISRLFNCNLAYTRMLYLVFQLTASSNGLGGVAPYNSPVSSSPNTCANVKISNFNIAIGGHNIFYEPQYLNTHWFHNYYFPEMTQMNGNNIKSLLYSGQLTEKDYLNGGYQVYAIDMKKVSDSIADSLPKSFVINFSIDNALGLTYDCFAIVSQDMRLDIFRANGEVTAPGA